MKLILIIGSLLSSLMISAQGLTLASKSLKGQGTKGLEFSGFGCNGQNVSPQLAWSGAPESTKSYAITVYDPDAPTGSGWWHWLVFNIPSNVHEIKEGASGKSELPEGIIQSINDYGIKTFGGPCPPEGDGYHQYIFTVYALDVEKLELKDSTNPAVVGYFINSHTIQKATIVTYYKR